MKVGVLGPSENLIGYTTKRILEEGEKKFDKVELVPIIQVKLKLSRDGVDALYGDRSLKEYDYIIPRIDSKRAEAGYPVMRFLESMGVRTTYRAETVINAHNKFLTLQRLVEEDIPIPKTYLTGSKESGKEILDREDFPVIIKLLSSFGGQGVMFIENRKTAESTIDTLKALKQELCLEEFIENPGEDIRGIVAGDEIIASYKRVASEGEKRANLYAGGKAKAFKLSPEMKEIALKSARALKAKVCAVDMLQSKKGDIYVIEVNINPGIKGIEKATDKNVAHKIVDFVDRDGKD